jgi:hypothetical protein
VQIRGGQLQISDPGGSASGAVAPDGTAHLASPQGETYDVISSSGGMLVLEEVNGGCRFRTVMTFAQPFPALVSEAPATTAAPTTTAAPATTLAPPATPAPRVPVAHGSSLTWLWVALVVVGGVIIVVAWILGRGPTVLAVAHDCNQEWQRWQESQAICAQSRAAAAEEAKRATAARQQREALGREMSAYRDSHPGVDPAGDRSYVENVATGERVTQTDVELQRQAEQEIYRRYRRTQGPEAAARAVDEFRQADTLEARLERRKQNAAARVEYQKLADRFHDAETAEHAQAKAAADAEAKAAADCRAAELAHRAYEECIRQAAEAGVAEEASRDDGLPTDDLPKPRPSPPVPVVPGGGGGTETGGGNDQPACDCTIGVHVEGPDRFDVAECRWDYDWAMAVPSADEFAPSVAPDEVRVLQATPRPAAGAGGPGATEPRLRNVDVRRLSQAYQTRVVRECRGGGTLSGWQQRWTFVVQKAADPRLGATTIRIEVQVTAQLACPGRPPRTVSALGVKSVEVARSRCCCGPDVSEDFLACINRVIARLAIYPESRGWTTSGVEFLARNGAAMAYRPFPNLGVVQPGGCPCEGCQDTVTLLDVCVPAHVTGDLLFGVCAGWFGTDMGVMTLGGEAAKWAHYPGLELPDTAVAETLWGAGYRLGDRAYQAHQGDRPSRDAVVTPDDLAGVLYIVREAWRRDCDLCPQPGPTPAPIDFSREGWNW